MRAGVLLVVAALALSTAGLAAAQPSVGVRIDEMDVRFRTDREADFWINGTLDGGTARQLRLLADLNFDQRVGESEAERVESLLQRTLVEQSPELGRAQASLLLDDRVPTDTGRLDLELDGLTGARASTEPATVTLATNVTWPPQNGTGANDTHVFRIPGDAVVANAMVTLEAPPGLEVNETQGLDRVTLSEDNRVARGQAQEGRDVEATFAPPPPPPPPDEPEDEEPLETPLPGVGLILLVAGAVALLLTRRARP